MVCCVIGGTGFIGRVVVQQLLTLGREVRVIGRRASQGDLLASNVDYRSGDYGAKGFLESALDGVDEVIDLAYSTVPKTSFDDPVYDITTNLPQAVNLFQVAAEKKSLRKLVVVSSGGTVYGPTGHEPIPETHPTNPISPYGITKLAIEKYALMYHCIFGVPVSIVRPSNAYGEGQIAFRGQGFVATAIASILQGRTVTVFGGDRIIRDYIHVSDVASGIIAVLDAGTPGNCYNLGSGQGLTTNQVLDAISALAEQDGQAVSIDRKPFRPFDVPTNILDCGRIRVDTGWNSQIAFSEGLARVWQWFLAEFKQPAA